jgi:DNA topoisomerase-2
MSKTAKTAKKVKSKEKENEIELDNSDTEIVEKKEKVRKKELKIEALELGEQIKKRPGMYIGNPKKSRDKSYLYVLNETENGLKFIKNIATYHKTDAKNNLKYKKDGSSLIVTEEVAPNFSEGFIRIFIEVLSNAVDNVWRSKEFGLKATEIRVNLKETEDKGKYIFEVQNDGKALIHGKHENGRYNVEIVFSRFTTSTNYDDNEDKKTSGLNGYGVKLTGVFSKWLSVYSYNNEAESEYTQTFENNLNKINSPKIKSKKIKGFEGAAGITKVSWLPEYECFEMGETGVDEDTLKVIKRLVYEMAMILSKYKVKVYFNDEKIKIASLKDYANLFVLGETEEIITISTSDSEVCLLPNKYINKDKKFFHNSFVNGIRTSDGGFHLDSWCEKIFGKICDELNGKKRKSKEVEKPKRGEKGKNVKKETEALFTVDYIKDYFAMFVCCEVVNPVFLGQNKTKLSSNKTNAIDTKLTPSVFNKIIEWSVIEDIKRSVMTNVDYKINTNKKDIRLLFGKKYEPANNKDDPLQNILTVVEGDSAATFVVSGLDNGLENYYGKKVCGRDYIAIFRLKGKMINPRGKDIKKILETNEEVRMLIAILGLEFNVDYTKPENFKKLKFGRVSTMTDADNDGKHIIGLLYNFFHFLFPSLLKVSGFFVFNRTPIITVNDNLPFYDIHRGEKYITENGIKNKCCNYYKGLGSIPPELISKYFGKRFAEIVYTEDIDELVNKAFGKDEADYRKILVNTKEVVLLPEGKDYTLEKINFKDFTLSELAESGKDQCGRTIRGYSGLHESQRKIIFGVKKLKLFHTKKEVKIAQLANRIAELSHFEHGESSMCNTITNMTQRFVGSNNVPLLQNRGSTGSRKMNGKDASNERYTFTRAEEYFLKLFREEDEDYISNVITENQIVEKVEEYPVICLLLANGADNVGWGFSTKIPMFNPLEICEWQKSWIKNKDYNKELTPWFRGFKGEIKKEKEKWCAYGKILDEGKNLKRIIEAPPSFSIDDVEEAIKDLLSREKIKDYKNYSNETHINFLIYENDEMNISLSTMKLREEFSYSNLVVYDADKQQFLNFQKPEDILREYCKKRLKLYELRLLGEIKKKEKELKYETNIKRFIEEVNNENINLKNEINEIENKLEELKFDKKETKRSKEGKKNNEEKEEEKEEKEEEKEEENEEENKSFNYLINLSVSSLSLTNIKKHQIKIEKLLAEINEMKKQKPEEIWEREINEFSEAYEKWMNEENKKESKKLKINESNKNNEKKKVKK